MGVLKMIQMFYKCYGCFENNIDVLRMIHVFLE